jgi:hypothetical protein
MGYPQQQQQQPWGQQQAFPAGGYMQQAPAPVAATPAPASAAANNPFAAAAGANPFAAKAAAVNPFAGGVKEFKPKDPRVIMGYDDNAPIDFEAFGASKKKKKTQAELEAEKAKADEEANAKLSFKGKPSSFFIMGHDPNDTTDATGQCRVPTAEQKMFIILNYPTFSQPAATIAKIYELYNDAAKHEAAKSAEKEIYTKPKREQRQEVVYEDVIIADDDTTFGAPVGKQNKKTQKKADQQAEQAREAAKKKVQKSKEKEDAQEKAAQKKVSVAIKDINVVPDEAI